MTEKNLNIKYNETWNFKRIAMNLKPVQLQLETEEVRRILQVTLDEDAHQALDFVKNVLAKKVEKALQRH
jgi:hypothetical protein